ncbi:MAG: hypothetical protein RJB13_684 [Pseudomonadota bacterium]
MRFNNELSSELNLALTPEWSSLTARARGAALQLRAVKCEALKEMHPKNYQVFQLTFIDGTCANLYIGVMNTNPSGWLFWMGEAARPHDLLNTVVSHSTQLLRNSDFWIIESDAGKIQMSDTAESFAIFDVEGNPIYSSAQTDLLVGDVPVSFAFFKHASGFGVSIDGGGQKQIMGGGEQFGQTNLLGRVYDVMNSDALGVNGHFRYQSTPFFLSNEGHSFAMLQCEPGRIDFGCRRHEVFTFSSDGPSLGIYLANKAKPTEAVEHWRALMGGVSNVPRWSYGLWLSRCFYKNESEVREVVEKNSVHNLGASVINLDARAWMRAETRTDFVWDSSRWSPFETFIPWLREKGFHVCLWENPYVSSATETLYEEAKSRGFFAKTAQGEVYPYQWVPVGLEGFPQPPVAGLVDFTHPEAKSWWKDLHRPFLRAGVNCFKTDFGEEIPHDARFSDGSTGLELRNVYSDLYNLTVMEVMREECGENGIVWARSGFTKMGKTPVKWAGDSQTSWSALRASLRGGLSQAAGGAVFWSHDIGGFYGKPPSSELYLRWAQLGLWCSHARMHGTTAREPWEFGNQVLEQVISDAARRERLLDYFESAGEQCVRTQQSFVCPLWLYHPSDPLCWHIDDQFFSGSKDILVAPFLKPDGGRDIYLPQGEWLFLNTGETYRGNRHVTTSRINTCPVFVRTDSRWKDFFASTFHR